MPHPIIVGVDFTERAQDAIALGRLLADTLETELVVAHAFAYDEQRSRFASAGFEELMRRDAEEALQALAERAGPDARLVTVADSSPARGLHALAEREQAWMLVTASSHRGRLGRTFLGDVAQQTLHAAPCAVAVAPRGFGSAEHAPVGTIGVGFDGGDESRAALSLAATLALALGAKLRLLASSYMAPVMGGAGWAPYDMAPIILQESKALDEDVAQAVAALTVDCIEEMSDQPPVQELLRLSAEVDLLVLGSRGYGPVSRLLAGTTSDAVVRDAACPILVLPRGALAPAAGDAAATAASREPAHV